MSKVLWCETCCLKMDGRPMSEAEMIQHLDLNPTHMAASDNMGGDDEEKDFKDLVNG